jgi:predicted transcriptional regulator
MRVKDVMTLGVEWISSDTTLREAAQKMKELDVGLLPICGYGPVLSVKVEYSSEQLSGTA